MVNQLTVNASELPLVVQVLGPRGEREYYEMKPAGRKFGACLCKIEGPLRKLLLKEER